MATRQTATIARYMRMPAIILLLIWMIVPLAMTLYFSFLNYNLLSPGQVTWAGWFQLPVLLHRPRVLRVDLEHARPRPRGASHHRHRRHRHRHADRPADVGPGDRAHPRHLAVLRHAAGGGADLEEHDHAPRLRRFGRRRPLARATARRLVRPVPALLDHHHRRLAVASLRHADPAHLAPVARRRADGGRRNGRRGLLEPVLLPRPAAHEPGDDGCDPDPDDLPARDLRRDPRHHQRRGPATPRPTSSS